MQVSLFRALKSANISDDTAEQVVYAFEEHIDMAVNEAMKHYDNRITAMQTVIEAKLEAGFKQVEGRLAGIEGKVTGMQTSIDMLKWAVITIGTLNVLAAAIAGYLKLLI